jgi:formate C-acetyltransferase
VAGESGELLIFDVQRFCVHDGPGIRTVVFFKGCPLRCRWCQNPESLRSAPELVAAWERCRGCLECHRACPHGAITVDGGPRLDRALCQACGRCAEACPTETLRLVGRLASPEALLDEVLADRSYYEATGGGVTLSGGEPLAQAAGAARLLELCRRAGVHTAVETSGAVPAAALALALPQVDLLLFDLKAGIDPLHQELTGTTLERVADRARQALDAGASVVFRTPVVPGLNDSDESLAGLAALLRSLGRAELTLLPYHRGGEVKIARLGSDQPRLGLTLRDGEVALVRAVERLAALGIAATAAGPGEAGPPDATAASVFPDRVRRLRLAVGAARPAVCAERALLITEYFEDRRNEAKPAVTRRAEALRHVLRRRRAAVWPDELLVGSFTSKRVGGSILPELHGVAVLEDLLAFDRRKVNPLSIDRADRRALATRVLPFWSTRFLALRAFSRPRALRFVADQLRLDRYVINETGGISHFAPDYSRLLRLGTSGLAAEAADRRDGLAAEDPARRFHEAVITVCRGLEEMAAGHAAEAYRLAGVEPDEARRRELLEIARTCERIPRQPAATLREAFQTVVFAQIALNLESLDNSVSPGRLDQVLWPWAEADLAAGRIDRAGLRELVGCFTVKLCEIVPVFSRRMTRIHGGLFNGQVVVVGGVDRDGRDAVNELTWAFLDAMDELRMRQPNYHARLHRGSPAAYVSRVASMLRDGSGAPSLMNDDVVVPMLEDRGVSLADARDYSPVGCVEPVACGRTFGSTDAALVNVALCLERALGLKPGGARAPDAAGCTTIDGVLHLLKLQVDDLFDDLVSDLRAIEEANARLHPTPLTSALIAGCLERGLDATAGGARYNASGVQPVGVVDVADSLAAIDDVVFRRRRCTMAQLVDAARADFAGAETLQGHLLRAPKYGNDDPRADRLVRDVATLCASSLARHGNNTRGGPYLTGLYSVTAHVAFGETTGALPSGRRAGRPLANGLSPANGMDRRGPTASLDSAAAADQRRVGRNGVNVNLKLDRASLAGARGARALEGLIRGYFDLGGMQLQVNVVDPAVLLEAARDPAAHPWLLVRVSGYSAYFADLAPEVRQEIVERSLNRPG